MLVCGDPYEAVVISCGVSYVVVLAKCVQHC